MAFTPLVSLLALLYTQSHWVVALGAVLLLALGKGLWTVSFWGNHLPGDGDEWGYWEGQLLWPRDCILRILIDEKLLGEALSAPKMEFPCSVLPSFYASKRRC